MFCKHYRHLTLYKQVVKYVKPKNILISLLCSGLLIAETYGAVPFILDAAVKTGNNRNYAQTGAFIPLHLNDHKLIFTDIRFMHNLPHTDNKQSYSAKLYEANFGAGYRVAYGEDMVVGLAAYYDIRNAQINKAYFSQVTMNIHLLTSTWQTQANLYSPIGAKQFTKTNNAFTGKGKVINRDVFFLYDQNKISEKSLSGLDLRISRNISSNENIRVGSLLYYFNDKRPISGIGVDASWAMNENIKLEASYTYDKIRKSNILLGVRFTVPVGTVKRHRNIDKLMTTRVERDLDIITNKSSNITQNNVQQNNMMGVSQNDLSAPNNPANIQTNLQILSRLQEIHNQGGTIILANEGQEFDYNVVSKIGGSDLKSQIYTEQKNVQTELAQNENISTIISNAAQTTNPLTRQVKILGAMKAYQDKTGSEGFYLAGKMQINRDAELAKLFNKYAKLISTGNKILTINLPGYGNAVVERAGTMLLIKENGQVYAIVGSDANNQNAHKTDGKLPWNAWFSGSVNKEDSSVWETVLRESYEESAGTVYISQNDFDSAINDGRFFYSPEHKLLTIVYPDTEGIYNILDLTNNLNKLRADPTIAYSMKEMVEYSKVPISEMLKLYNRMGSASNNPHDIAYNVDLHGRFIRIESHYARALGATLNGQASIIKAQSKLTP